jgi:hypothetical protein
MRDFYWGFLSTWIPQGESHELPPKLDSLTVIDPEGIPPEGNKDGASRAEEK